MQRYRVHLSPEDQRTARRWTLAWAGIYSVLLAGFILYTALTVRPNVEFAAQNKAGQTSQR
jgi:hypothetical protein